MTIQQLIANHMNVVGYLAGLAKVLNRIAHTQVEDALLTEAQVSEVQDQMTQMAKVLSVAAEVLEHPGVVGTAILEATQGNHGTTEEQDPEALLTTRKRAQA